MTQAGARSSPVYTPRPLDTSSVELDPELLSLVERVAEQRHDLWARERLREGWTFGPTRDEARRTDPELLCYAELSEQAKQRERQTALEVIEAILGLGFSITRSALELPRAAPERRESIAAPPPAEDLARAAEQLLRTGEPLLAYEVVEAALVSRPGELRLRQLRGLALARSGASKRANQTMLALLRKGHTDGETLGILARTHKDLAARAATEKERNHQLQQALQAYLSGYDAARRLGNAADAYFTGINAATLSLLTGDPERAFEVAHEVRTLCREELARAPREASYWLHATLAEAALLLGERQEAEEQYGRAAERAGANYGDLSTTRHQARLVLSQRGEDASFVDKVLRIPPLAMFTGHMIDQPGRQTPRFPPELEGAVSRGIRERLGHLRPAAGYASAACGADLLFLEAMHAEGREFHVVLPFPPAAFGPASVDVVPGWRERFDRMLAAATSVTTASDHDPSGSPTDFVYANLILSGMAALHATRLETELVGLAVWDGKPAEGPGGTASLVEHWRSRGAALEWIDPAGLGRSEEAAGPRPAAEGSARHGVSAGDEVPDDLMAMLFADAVGYSKLSESQIRLFVAHVLAPIAELIERSPHPPVLKETAGDGFYFVFPRVRDAGIFALALQDLASQLDWEARGLPATLELRVGLHCGPVQKLVDPITGQKKYTGPHTSRTARIEPITPPGQVYASQAFAAVAAATGVAEVAFDYVGRTALAKEYGSLPLYHVRRT